MNDYVNRIVVFMDILGFKNLIQNTANNTEIKKNIFNVMNVLIKDIQESNYMEPIRLDKIGKEVSIFSDSIIISYDVNFPSAFFYILIDIIHIQIDLIYNGILVRGGISYGELFHKRNIVFGPAMVDAYKLESEAAIYPRVIISPQLVEFALNNFQSPHNIDDERKEVYSLLKPCNDGFYFVDFLNQSQELDDPMDMVYILQKLRNMIYNNLNYAYKEGNHGLIGKYEWLRYYYNSVAVNYPNIGAI